MFVLSYARISKVNTFRTKENVCIIGKMALLERGAHIREVKLTKKLKSLLLILVPSRTRSCWSITRQ